MGEERNFEELIETMRSKGNLTSDRVEQAIRKALRHLFVPEEVKDRAYVDAPLSIGHGQTISQPSVVVKMTEYLEVEEGDKILEIGAGSGWQSAVLSHLVGEGGKVYTVEVVESLAEKARESLNKTGVGNVEVVVGDGSTGLEDHAPYDGIICTAVSSRIQEEWVEQLKVGGRIVSPVSGVVLHNLVVVEKVSEDEQEVVEKERGYRFVKLKGEKGF
ncbi:MAG: protein-L-isoaspartate(D-aspartate) O-methyltransferase [Candidatus Aenigmatarchaeota archaeon]